MICCFITGCEVRPNVDVGAGGDLSAESMYQVFSHASGGIQVRFSVHVVYQGIAL
jgi:hypothetical protein